MVPCFSPDSFIIPQNSLCSLTPSNGSQTLYSPPTPKPFSTGHQAWQIPWANFTSSAQPLPSKHAGVSGFFWLSVPGDLFKWARGSFYYFYVLLCKSISICKWLLLKQCLTSCCLLFVRNVPTPCGPAGGGTARPSAVLLSAQQTLKEKDSTLPKGNVFSGS